MRREEKRREWKIPEQASVVTLVARLVPIKRVDRFLRIADRLANNDELYFVVVGDGHLRDQLIEESAGHRIRSRLRWAGFERDMPAVCFASDVIALTSDNEGTPVSLIEAQAAGRPCREHSRGGTALPYLTDNRAFSSTVTMTRDLPLPSASSAR